jgi:hypothetical protein
VGFPRDDRFAFRGHVDEFPPGESAVVQLVERERGASGARGRRAESRRRADALVDLDVRRRVERLRHGPDGVPVGVGRDVLAPDAGHLDGGPVGLLDAEHVRRAVECDAEHVEPAAEVRTRRRRPDGDHATGFREWP